MTNVDEAPTDLTLDNATIPENGEANAVVASLILADPDAASTSIDPVIITEGVGEKLWEFATGGQFPNLRLQSVLMAPFTSGPLTTSSMPSMARLGPNCGNVQRVV